MKRYLIAIAQKTVVCLAKLYLLEARKILAVHGYTAPDDGRDEAFVNGLGKVNEVAAAEAPAIFTSTR